MACIVVDVVVIILKGFPLVNGRTQKKGCQTTKEPYCSMCVPYSDRIRTAA
jgi:hypothetical protein